jgi:hypothetical protein
LKQRMSHSKLQARRLKRHLRHKTALALARTRSWLVNVAHDPQRGPPAAGSFVAVHAFVILLLSFQPRPPLPSAKSTGHGCG